MKVAIDMKKIAVGVDQSLEDFRSVMALGYLKTGYAMIELAILVQDCIEGNSHCLFQNCLFRTGP